MSEETPPEPPERASGAPEDEGRSELRCTACEARLDPDQAYCLECGTPTPAAPRLRRARSAGWILGIGLLAAGLGAGALAYAISADDGDRPARVGSETVVSDVGSTLLPPDTTLEPGTDTSGFPSDTSGFSTDTSGFPTDTTDTTDTAGAEPFVSDWPSGRSGFTAILSSVRDLEEARRTRDRVRSETGEPAGILYSSDHPGLRPGYYAVFSGVFATHAQALAQARKLAGRFPGAYPRRVAG